MSLDPGFRRLIDEHAPVRQAGSGFTFTEGPIWHPTEQYLLSPDMPADVRRRLDRAGVRRGGSAFPINQTASPMMLISIRRFVSMQPLSLCACVPMARERYWRATSGAGIEFAQ
jgi:sugar lactone lactonase YvrE